MDIPLRCDRVTKRYGDFVAVQDLDLAVARGSIHGFLGPNGAGKTTTLRMILGILRPSSGSISVLGGTSALEVRNRVGYLPEEKGLYKKMTATAVIAYFATLKGMRARDARLRARALLAQYGLGAFADARTEALSKGMGQKVQVLAAIAHDPELVILDEPFSGLDPVNQEVLESVMRDLAARGRTILFSTHIMQHAERLCDRITILRRGTRVFDGTLPEARRLVPRTIDLETADDPAPLGRLHEVIELRACGPSPGRWQLHLREGAGVQPILEACFTGRIQLRAFQLNEPTLHDVFVRLAGESSEVAA